MDSTTIVQKPHRYREDETLSISVNKVKVLGLKFLVYSVLEPAVGYLTTLHFNFQQGTHPTLV